jgi:hypothetical protein
MNHKELFIADTILKMREYQKINKVKKQCTTNCQYLYDCIKYNIDVKLSVRPMYVVSIDENTFTLMGGHVVVMLRDTLLEPSYDVHTMKNKKYYHNISDVLSAYKIHDKSILKKAIKDHINFQKTADEINSGVILIASKEHYNKQADYVECSKKQ